MSRSTRIASIALALLAGGVSLTGAAAPPTMTAGPRIAQQQPPLRPQAPRPKLPQPGEELKRPSQTPKALELPDLIVSGITVPYGRPLRPGQNLGSRLRVAVKNVGDAVAPGTTGRRDPANGYMVDVVLSTDRTAPVRFARHSNRFHEDVLLKGGRFSRTVDLAPGARHSYRDRSAVIPERIEPGVYYLCAVVDPGRKVDERDEGNNVQCSSSLEIVTAGPEAGTGPGGTTRPDEPGALGGGAPDLIAVLTDPMTGTVAVRNIGTARAGASKLALDCEQVGFTGSGGGCPEASGLSAYTDPRFPDQVVVDVPPLPAGDRYSHRLAFWPALDWRAGVAYRFTAEADAGHAVAESNEGNNTATSRLTGR